MKRRKFLKITAVVAPTLSCFPANLTGVNREKMSGKLEKRSLGRTGEQLSIIGFGGIVVMNATTSEASKRVSKAVKYGVNYFDVAPTYGDAEIKLGPALKPYRKNIFLACKTQQRKREEAQRELEQSLRNLRTDYFDLYQLHAVNFAEDVETIFGPDGAIETFVRAKKEGKIRYMGFSAHSVEAAMALMDRFDFDTILFPVNYRTWYAGNFGPQVLDKALKKEMGILAIKSMAKGPRPNNNNENDLLKCWYEPLTDPTEASMALRYTLSHPVTALIPPGDEDLFEMALKLMSDFKPLDSSEIDQMKKKGLEGKPLFHYFL